MPNPGSIPATGRNLGRFLASVGAAACLLIVLRIWQVIGAYQEMWPLPALYFLEMVAVSFLGLLAGLRGGSSGGLLLWTAVGVLMGFSFMAMFSVGIFFVPIALIFGVVALLVDAQEPRNLVLHLGLGVIAAVAQAGLILAVAGIVF